MGIYDDPSWMADEIQSPTPNDQDYWSRFMGQNLQLAGDDDSFADQRNEVNLDPFQDFKWGMNMPTFQVAKGALDTGAGIMNAINKYREFGLRKDMFDEQRRIGDRDYLDAKGLRNIKFDKMDFNRAEKNLFKQAYGGPEGKYLMEDPVNRRSLAV